ncbi:hypothetical protein PG994_010360 [Apiospora phragmitis]|uniref:C3H1-type domain-containing protein n=1 Tax=Apiospora phragmitis TaxID=2905665 RepID=A0ABR1TPP5_9PEZI
MTTPHLQQLQHRSVHAGGGSPRMLRPPPHRHHAAAPSPLHFLVRPATTKHTASGTVTMPGPMVPLVAVDQLPEWLDIAGVPRELTVEQTMGLQNLGSAGPETAECYELRLHQDRRESKNHARTASSLLMDADTTALDPHDKDLPGSSSSKHCQKKHSDAVTVVNGTSGHHGNMNNNDDSTSSALKSSSDTSYSSSTEPATSNTRGKKTTKKGKEKAAKVSKQRQGRNHQTCCHHSSEPAPPTPPPPTVPVNPYPILRHCFRGEPAPPSHHPASRLLSAMAPASDYLYSPAHPQRQTTTTPTYYNNSNKPQHSSSSSRHQRAIVHCRHWCHHGSCKYGLECRYEHEMPRSHEKLREVGLADWPNWYKAAFSMARDMQTQNSRRKGRQESPLVDDVMTVIESGTHSNGGTRRKGSSHHKARDSRNSIVVANDASSPSTVAYTSSEKRVVVEERLGRLANVESDESDGSSSSAEHVNPEMGMQQTPATKKQDVAEDITTPVEKLVDI